MEHPRSRLRTTLAGRPHLPRRTIRLRLTAVYGALFLASGIGLLVITYLLVRHATAGSFTFTGPNGLVGSVASGGGPAGGPPLTDVGAAGNDAGTSVSPAQTAALADQLLGLATTQRADQLHQLLIQSGIALAIMAVASIGFGWLVAGRVLRPLRTITDLTRNISATDLHQRLDLIGPDDEVTRLADTVDGLLGRLDAAFTAQRHFIANASHELRTPITVARALLQMILSDREATLETFRATCQDVVKEGEQQERLIEALLVLARSERGLDLRSPVDLAAITADVLRTRRPEAAYRGLLLHADLEPATVDGDAHLAERLVANLVDNALRHNRHGGSIEVSTGSSEGRGFLSVTNTGPVVPPQDVARLLQPFQRIGAESTDHGDGLGLGLAIVQAIANGHGATLSCRAQEQGGLHIDVGFPAQSERLAPRVAPGPGPRTAPTLPRLHSGDGRIAHPSVTLGDTEVEDRP